MAEEGQQVRAFISIPVEPAILEALQKFQSRLDQEVPAESVRWSSAEQLHLTLKFLGNVKAGEVPNLEAALQPIGGRFRPLQLRAEGLGCFPTAHHPRVIWVGLAGDLEQLKELQHSVEQASNPWTEKAEHRAFHPHLTLGRVREASSRLAREIGGRLEKIPMPAFGSWRAREFRLMRSQLSPKGAVHTILAAYPLAGGGG